ncbi:MAG: hypothetical protein GF421_01300 [Candidatus Aminicenantes bacterium]|nr:hypothetical protein [Candidatus Aminicenantes bacterium]
MDKINNLSINDLLPVNARPFPKLLWLILVISFLLNIMAINWGLPSPSFQGWSANEITPSSVLSGMETKYSREWSSKYPPLHYYTLSLFYLPVYCIDALNRTSLSPLTLHTIYFVIGRLLSVFMGTFIVFMVYLCGCEVTDRKTAPFASLITAWTPPFLYYSKTANVDIPYLFWFVIALYFFIRILKNHRTSDYILFSGTAAFSIGTKDQAYGLFILTPFIIIYSLYRRSKVEDSSPNLIPRVFHKKILLAFVTGTFLFIIIYNLLLNFEGIKSHFLLITGPARGERFFPSSASGFLQMLVQTFKNLEFILGWPLLFICILGFVYALTKKKKHPVLLWFAVLIASYYVTFICIVGKNLVKHLLPIYILMSFYGALCLSFFLHSSRRFKVMKYLLVIILFANSLFYSFSVNVIMMNDSRYYVENWMKKHIPQNESILFVGSPNFLPRNKGFPNVTHRLHPNARFITETNPSFILINSEILKSKQPFLYQKLSENRLDYELVLKYKSSPWLSLLPEHKIRLEGDTRIITNLDLINPEIMIFQKVKSPTHTGD